VAACLEAPCPLGGLGWRYQEEDLLALLVYPTPGQLVGGAAEGTIVLPGFALDVLALAALPCSSASRPSPGRRTPGAPTMPMGLMYPWRAQIMGMPSGSRGWRRRRPMRTPRWNAYPSPAPCLCTVRREAAVPGASGCPVSARAPMLLCHACVRRTARQERDNVPQCNTKVLTEDCWSGTPTPLRDECGTESGLAAPAGESRTAVLWPYRRECAISPHSLYHTVT